MDWILFWKVLGVCIAVAGVMASSLLIGALMIAIEFSKRKRLVILTIGILTIICCTCVAIIIGLIKELAIIILTLAIIAIFIMAASLGL